MIKYVQCVKRRADISLHDFRQLWEQYAEQARNLGEAIGVDRISFSTTLAVDENLRVQLLRGSGEAFDGVAEFYLENAQQFMRLSAPEVQPKVTALQRFQETFLDLAHCSFFFTTTDD